MTYAHFDTQTRTIKYMLKTVTVMLI